MEFRAVLLLRANRMVATWSLIDELWAENRPQSPRPRYGRRCRGCGGWLADGDPTGQRVRLLT